MKIDNYTEISEILRSRYKEYPREYTHIKVAKDFKKPSDTYTISNQFRPLESGTLKLNIVGGDVYLEQQDMFPVNLLDGLQVYLHKLNLNRKASVKHLGGKAGTQGIGGAISTDVYGGKPRFENHIEKNTIQYKLPADKSNIKPTLKGESLLKFIKLLMQKSNLKENTTQPSPPTQSYQPHVLTTFGVPPTEQLSPPPTEQLSPPPTEQLSPPPTGQLSPLPTGQLSPPPTGQLSPPPTVQISTRDPQRSFTADQKRIIFNNQNKLCGMCKQELDNYHLAIEYDHIIDHQHDGPTTVENGQALCLNCHKRKHVFSNWSPEEWKQHLQWQMTEIENAINRH
jgi:hypothetical protein